MEYIYEYINQLTHRVKLYNDCFTLSGNISKIIGNCNRNSMESIRLSTEQMYDCYLEYANNLSSRSREIVKIIEDGLIMSIAAVQIKMNNTKKQLESIIKDNRETLPKHTINILENEILRLSEYSDYDNRVVIKDFLQNKDYSLDTENVVKVIFEDLIHIRDELIEFANGLTLPVVKDYENSYNSIDDYEFITSEDEADE